MVPGVLAGIAAKLTGLGVAAKAGVGLGIATLATAGVATVMPVVVPDAPAGAPTAVEVQLPTVPDSTAGLGLSTAADAGGASRRLRAEVPTVHRPRLSNVPVRLVPLPARPVPWL